MKHRNWMILMVFVLAICLMAPAAWAEKYTGTPDQIIAAANKDMKKFKAVEKVATKKMRTPAEVRKAKYTVVAAGETEAVAAAKATVARHERERAVKNARIMYAPAGATVGLLYTVPKAMIKGATSPTSSPVEYAGFPTLCRMVNAGAGEVKQRIIGGATEMVTPFTTRTFTPDAGEYGNWAQAAINRGPIANVVETGCYVAAPVLASTGEIASPNDWGVGTTEWALAGAGQVVGPPLAVGVDYVENKIFNYKK